MTVRGKSGWGGEERSQYAVSRELSGKLYEILGWGLRGCHLKMAFGAGRK